MVHVDLKPALAVAVQQHRVERVNPVFDARVMGVHDHRESGLAQQGKVRLAGILATGVLATGVGIDRYAVAGEPGLDLLDHLRRVAHRMELIKSQGQTIADDVDHCGHLHDVEVHADVQGLAWLDALTCAALAAAERVVDDAGIVLEAGFVLLPERARVHLSACRVQLFSRYVSALQ
ncbi:hypothetical protein D3C80_1148340 [compost metagenome]